VPAEKFDYLKIHDSQGIAAEISPVNYLSIKELIQKTENSKNPLIVVLDEINDPHNLGAIIRNAVAFGSDGIVIGKWRSANITDTVEKTSAGAVEHIAVARVSNIADCLRTLKDSGFYILGAENGNEKIDSLKIPFPAALVIGSEGSGLRQLTKQMCTKLVSIPQTSSISSINASCASAIMLYEIYKYRCR
jgi:23S rRNA (guanosine2251-2'-O)-methyltransferase